MSANLIVDLGGTALSYPTLPAGASGTLSGGVFTSSGQLTGQSVDMLHANTFTNLLVGGISLNTSGQLLIQVQTSDTDTSGNFTDPTSGLAQLPTYFESGGIVRFNSGGILGGTIQGAINTGGGLGNTAGTSGAPNSGCAIQSGFQAFAGFQRVGRYARANVLSGGFFVGPVQIAFVSQLKTTGSGGGFTLSPTSGVVNV
jgi:hypothetical protein